MLIIEVDGQSHNLVQSSDDIRDYDLKKAGYKTLRFTNAEILVSLDTVLKKILFECSFRSDVKRSAANVAPKLPSERRMVVPLPRVVYEEPLDTGFRPRAGKIRVRKALPRGEKVRAICAICRNPIADSDLRIRHKASTEQVQWVHKSCAG